MLSMPVHARVSVPAKKPGTKNLIHTIKAVPAVLLVSLSMSVFTESKEKPSYQTGKLLDVAVQDVSRGTAIIGGMAAPISREALCVSNPIGRSCLFRGVQGGQVELQTGSGGERSH